MKAYSGACHTRLGHLMRLTEDQSLTADRVPSIVTLAPDDESLSTQLYYMLIMSCKTGALDRVVNAGGREGLLAWRALAMHHVPKSWSQTAMLLELVTYDFTGDITTKIAAFDRARQTYEIAAQKKLGDEVAIAVLLGQMPGGAARSHLLTNMDQYPTWELAKDAMKRIRATQVSISPHDGSDMSALNAEMARADAATVRLDAFMKGAKGAGKKGSGKTGADSSKPPQLCPICSKGYHWKADCWQNAAKAAAKAAKEAKAVNHRAKRMGLHGSNDGKMGHIKKDCKNKPSTCA